MTTRAPWGGKISKAAVLSVAGKIADRDKLTWRQCLRRALTWAKQKADPYAEARARGLYSPRDKSPEARAHFSSRGVNWGLRGGWDGGR